MTGPIAARMILRDPSVDVAVLETARGGMLKRGMGYKRCNVGAVLNVQADHLGLRGVNTLEELARVKRIVVEIARDTAVLNADDPLCLKMGAHTKASHICYVTMNPGHELVKEHIRSGGRAAVLEKGINGDMITLYDHGAHMPLLWTHQIPATMEGRAMHNVQNAMFASAMAYAMKIRLEDIRHGLQTFDTSFFQAPGRMNVFSDHPFKVILDYGHNPGAVEAMCQLVRKLEVKKRRIVVIAAPGDRRDEDVREIARLAAGVFDFYICRRDDQLRGRASDEIPILLRDALLENGVDPVKIKVIPEEEAAVDEALSMARKEDLLLIFGDNLNRTWKQITGIKPGEEAPSASETITGASTLSPGAEAAPLRMARPGAPGPAKEKPESAGLTGMESGASWIRDERGVLLPREDED
jgi:cyanophycin synthetase